MSTIAADAVPIPPLFSNLRRFPLDGSLLLFDRESGLNALCDGVETATLRQIAPRVIQFGITNSCNLACTFCSRDLTAESSWTSEEAFNIFSELAQYGVLEVAFGGGEPWTFQGFAELVCRLHQETPLAISFTTNGIGLTADRVAAIRGRYGQLRLSLYENNNWRQRVAELSSAQARFGVNYLVTPERLESLEYTVLELVSLGCRDILLLSYNGLDTSMHLNAESAKDLSSRVAVLARALAGRCQIKLDVCWGERMEGVPRLFDRTDCGAGREFIVLTSDRQLQPCSFHDYGLPVANADEIMTVWRERQHELGRASRLPGCARAANYGLHVEESI